MDAALRVDQAFGEHPLGRPLRLLRRAPRAEAKQAVDEAAARIASLARPEVGDGPGVADEPPPGRALPELLDQARLADARLTTDVDGEPAPGLEAGGERAAELREL